MQSVKEVGVEHFVFFPIFPVRQNNLSTKKTQQQLKNGLLDLHTKHQLTNQPTNQPTNELIVFSSEI